LRKGGLRVAFFILAPTPRLRPRDAGLSAQTILKIVKTAATTRMREQGINMRATLMTWRMTVHAMCMFALLVVGFAHKIPSLSDAPLTPSEIVAYTLPDGTLPVLCISDQATTDQQQDHKHKTNSGCEACRISASILLPAPADTVGLPAKFTLRQIFQRIEEPVVARIFSPNTSPRAPPIA
jgi:hypothetical protein